MIFKRFFKSAQVDVETGESHASLCRIARESWDVAARRDACRRLTSLKDLREIAATDSNAGVRDIAQARYRHLLCGTDPLYISPLEERLAEAALASDERLLAAVAQDGREPELRQAAIARTTDPMVLAICAVRDPLAMNRQAAVERIADKAALEQVARQIGKKDKRVYRQAREKLRAILEQEALPGKINEQGNELCEKLERLGRHGNWEQDRGLLDLIERDWGPIAAEVDEGLRERYQTAHARFLAGYEAYRQANAERIAEAERQAEQQAERRAQLEGLLNELAGAGEIGDEMALRALRERVIGSWQDDRIKLPPTEQKGFDGRIKQALATLAGHEKHLSERRGHREQATSLKTTIDEMLAQSQPLNRARARPLLTKTAGLIGGGELSAELADSLQQAAAALEQRLEKQRHQVEQRLEQMPAKLEALESALADGELKRAEPLLQSLRASIDLAQTSGLSRKAFAEAERQIQQAAPRIKALQGWRRWGTDQKREALCTAISELRDSDASPDVMMAQLRELQQRWKALDQSGAPTDQRRWGRFQSVAEQIYDHCRPYLEEQAAEREANRRAREALCEELERFLDQVDWDRMDWKKAVKAAREMRQAWSNIGPPEGRHRRGLEKRFRTALKQLDRRLDAERTANRRLREALIAEVEAQIEQPNLDQAIEATKDCQRRWQTTVAGRKADENALWQRFRAACDAVFGRRRAQFEAREAELQENLATRAAICDEAQGLAGTDEARPDEIETALDGLERRWRETATLPLPRAAIQPLNQRWQSTRKQVLDLVRRRHDAERRASLDLLAQQAERCTQLEQATIGGAAKALDTSAIKAAWAELPRQQDETLQTAIGARFATALAVLEHGEPISPEALTESHQEREALCLQLEILAQIDSPADLANERLAFQVARLAERMESGEKDPLASAFGLLSKWYLCGPFPAAPELERRFERVRQALEQGRRRTEEEAA